jgi:broad specificity phosphatase PhoE
MTPLRRIALVRHGPSAYVGAGGWLDAAGVRLYCDGYDACGILDSKPPGSLVEACRTADCIIASPLRRAVESAERSAPGRVVERTPLLRELELEVPGRLRLPIEVWDALDHARWSWRVWRGLQGSQPAIGRSRAAADYLCQLSAEHSSIVAFTHGAFRKLLTAQLQLRNWRPMFRSRSFANWSAWWLAQPST